MAAKGRTRALAHVRMLFDRGTATGLTDGQLLERFAVRGDEGAELAFAVLVERHGPVVLGVCRSILRNEHDAMDAFQATFLVLARKGRSLWVRDSLGPWLHRVACHAAVRARKHAARRRVAERKAAEMTSARMTVDSQDDLAALVHEEVNRLPERYRAAVVLCDLEGRTMEDAARHLGCPVGTVASRVARGRQRLRDGLSRRRRAEGCTLSGASVGWPQPAESISPQLVDAVVHFVAARAAQRELATPLALEVLRAMTVARCWKVATLLAALGASTTGALWAVGRAGAQADRATDAPRADGTKTAEVKPGRLDVVFRARGQLQASRSTPLFSQVEGVSPIVFLAPEDARVTKGQLVCELDASSRKDQLAAQVSRVHEAEADLRAASLARELTELAMVEYTEGVYPAQLAAATSAVTRAKSTISGAEERLKQARAADERLKAMLGRQGGEKAPADITAGLDIADRIAAATGARDRGQGRLEAALARRDALRKFTRQKTVTQLRTDVEKARRTELQKQALVKHYKTQESKLVNQIERCKILAPIDGVVVYTNETRRAYASSGGRIETAGLVRERQQILSVVDIDGSFEVVARAAEAWVDQLARGQTVRVHVDAFPDRQLTGTVESVAPRPDPNTFFAAGQKVYTTAIALPQRTPGFRPGMTAGVEIVVAQLDNVLSVPVGAVVRYGDTDHVAVKTADGQIEWRAVALGRGDETAVEVKAGLKPGDAVVVEPLPLLSEEQKRKMAVPPAAPGGSGARAKGKRPTPPVSAETRAKLRSIPAEDRARLREASPQERSAILKRAGLTDEQIRQLEAVRRAAETPR